MSLHGILATLHDHLSTLHNGHDLRNLLALEVLDQPDGALAACKVVLQDVLDILEGLQKRRLASVNRRSHKQSEIFGIKMWD